MVKQTPRVVPDLNEHALIVDKADTTIHTIVRGDELELGVRVIFDGRFNKTRRRKTIPVVLSRETLIELLTQLAHQGGIADREFPFELLGAIEAGLERKRQEEMR